MSSSNSSSTLILIFVFVFGSGAYFLYKYTGSEEEPETAEVAPTKVSPKYETTVVAPKATPFQQSALSLERDGVWRVLNAMPDSEPELYQDKLAYGLGLLLDPASTEKEVRRGLAILNSHDIGEYGGYAKLRKTLLDTEKDPDFRRQELLRYLKMTEHRAKLLRSVLKDKRRINAFRFGNSIPLESELFQEVLPEPSDETISHEGLSHENDLLQGLDRRPIDPLNDIDLGPHGTIRFDPIFLTPPVDGGTNTIPTVPSGGVYE